MLTVDCARFRKCEGTTGAIHPDRTLLTRVAGKSRLADTLRLLRQVLCVGVARTLRLHSFHTKEPHLARSAHDIHQTEPVFADAVLRAGYNDCVVRALCFHTSSAYTGIGRARLTRERLCGVDPEVVVETHTVLKRIVRSCIRK